MPSCPFCAEEIKDNLAKCPACGEALVEGKGVPKKKSAVPIVAIVAILGAGMCCIVSIIAAIAIPNLIEARKHGNEASAIGALKTINTSQTLFREGDKEGDMTLDYAGSLAELSDATLIDGVLGAGVKQGYVFQVAVSPTTPEFLWIATASPVSPGTTGNRHFVINQAGVVYYSLTGPFSITTDCSIPAGSTPVGR